MEKVDFDCSSGTAEVLPLSDSERTLLAADQASASETSQLEDTLSSRRALVMAKIERGIDQAESAYAKWPTMSNAQKDAALRDLFIAVAKLGRLALDRFDVEEA